jgi:hypothetical protein
MDAEPKIITHNKLAFLLSLADRDDGAVITLREWTQMSVKYYHIFHPGGSPRVLLKSAFRKSCEWVSVVRTGSGYVCKITKAGRRVASGETPVRVRGMGLFCGLGKWKKTE